MRLEEWYRKTERPEERELRRKLRSRAIVDVVAEAVGCITLAILAALLFWLYLVATPDQSSAINDLEEDCPNAVRTSNLEAAP